MLLTFLEKISTVLSVQKKQQEVRMTKPFFAAVVALALAAQVAIAPATAEAPQAIHYKGKDATLSVTSGARAELERIGYSFPVKDGIMSWCLGPDSCAPLDVSAEDKHTWVAIDIKDVVRRDVTVVIICRSYGIGKSTTIRDYHVFDPSRMPEPFSIVDESADIVRNNCSKA